jgi:hypothetical protein
MEPFGLTLRQLDTGDSRQGGHLLHVETRHDHLTTPLPVHPEPVPALVRSGPTGYQDQDAVSVQALDRREQGLTGTHISPVKILDHRGHRTVVLRGRPCPQDVHTGGKGAVQVGCP